MRAQQLFEHEPTLSTPIMNPGFFSHSPTLAHPAHSVFTSSHVGVTYVPVENGLSWIHLVAVYLVPLSVGHDACPANVSDVRLM